MGERLFYIFIKSTTALVAIITMVILGMMFAQTHNFFQIIEWKQIFNTTWSPQQASNNHTGLGMMPLFAGTIMVAAISMFIALPVSRNAAMQLYYFTPRSTSKIIKPLIELLAGVPTVIYGYLGVVLVAPLISDIAEYFDLYSGSESALAAGIVIGVMITPFLITSFEDLLRALPKTYEQAALALGATKEQALIQIVLPAARPGMLAISLLGLLRAMGETMIVTMVAGLQANLTLNPLKPQTTVTTQIVVLLTGDQEFASPITLAAFAMGTFLLLLTLGINLIASSVINYYKKYY